MSAIKLRYLDKDRSAYVTCLTGSLKMVYFSFTLVLAVQISSVQVPYQYCSHIVVNVAL